MNGRNAQFQRKLTGRMVMTHQDYVSLTSSITSALKSHWMAIIINMFEKAYEFDNDVIFMSHLEFNFWFKAMVTQPVQQAPVVPLVVS